MTLSWFITYLIFVTSWCWTMVWLLPTTQMNMLRNVIHGQINTFHAWPFCFFTLSFKSLLSSHAYFFHMLPFPHKPCIFLLTHMCHLLAHQILNFIAEKKLISYQWRMNEINTSLEAVTPGAAKHTMWTTFVCDQRIQPLLPFVSGCWDIVGRESASDMISKSIWLHRSLRLWILKLSNSIYKCE